MMSLRKCAVSCLFLKCSTLANLLRNADCMPPSCNSQSLFFSLICLLVGCVRFKYHVQTTALAQTRVSPSCRDGPTPCSNMFKPHVWLLTRVRMRMRMVHRLSQHRTCILSIKPPCRLHCPLPPLPSVIKEHCPGVLGSNGTSVVLIRSVCIG